MDEKTIDARLYALTGSDVVVRICHGSDPTYITGSLQERQGVYTLENGGKSIARFTTNDVFYVELGREIVELKEGAGDYWPPVL